MTTNTLTKLSMQGRITGVMTKSEDDGTQQIDTFDQSVFSNAEPSDATKMYHTRVTVSNGGSTDFDLDALTNQLGVSTAFTVVYGFYIRNRNTATGDNIRVGNSDFATWLGSATDYVVVGPKGCLFLASNIDGYAVTASTGDVLTIAVPGGNNVIVDICIVGK